ncbi:LOG family protein [Candidatus Omnitrophota bacterium]
MKKKNKKSANNQLVKAYNNTEFLNSPSARLIRIMSEMIEPAVRFKKNGVKDTVVFFGSARILPRNTASLNLKKIKTQLSKTRSPSARLQSQHEKAKRDLDMSGYYEDAMRLSEKLTSYFKRQNKDLMVCSGGGPGIMEAASRGAKRAGGKSIGLNISIPTEQIPNPYQTRELAFEFHYFFIRKFWFFYLARALVVFPGGFGTMDELIELLTLLQTGNKSKKCVTIILYGSDYWREVINFNKMVEWGTISEKDLKLFKIFDSVDEVFRYLIAQLGKCRIHNKCESSPF